MATSQEQRAYWRRTLTLTCILLIVWFVFTFLTSGFAAQLNSISFLGFPLGFYMSAQGSVIIYVLIVWIYAKCMNRLDERYGNKGKYPPPA